MEKWNEKFMELKQKGRKTNLRFPKILKKFKFHRVLILFIILFTYLNKEWGSSN